MIDRIINNNKPLSKNINLVLSGTGALYPVHAGAVCALIDLGYKFKAISATSGGAIVASALCSGASRDKLRRKIINYNPWKILLRKPKLPFFNKWGFFDNSSLEEVLNEMFKGATFQSSNIPIEIVATQLDPEFGRVTFNIDKTPSMTLAQACRISSTIPILFGCATYKGKTFIDGSFSDDLPIKPFQHDFENTIALNVQIKSVVRPKTFWEFVRFCLHMVVNEQGFWKYTPSKLTTIPIEIYDYTTPLQFNLSRSDRKKLFDIGYNTVINHLK